MAVDPTQAMHGELGSDGVQVTAFCPGFVATPMTGTSKRMSCFGLATLTTVNPPECGKCENGVVDMKIGFGPCGECEELQEAYVRSQLQSSDKLAEATVSGGLRLSGSSPGKASARIRVRVAPGSTMWTRTRFR